MPLVDAPISPAGCFVDVAIHISEGRVAALTAAGKPLRKPFLGAGLVDPGASNSMIDVTIVKMLGLQPTGVISILTPSTGSTPYNCNQYDVSVWFPQAPTLIQQTLQQAATPHPVHLTLPVTDTDFSAQGFQVRIGRDVLARGVFIYNGLCGRFTLAF
jgi:hypothetical protein